ncbi:hypothetical protein [Archangium lansingense]|uniref:Uncharacterized protein n=1 Tax=Archangium lansingense TaxID=2995310 RepID=A0ABT4A2D9_9BACT|nr:hypothetical protein [Archangium lansinium]MCY1075809.1 hypothetical protein [Archangium lansinium]
MRIAEIMQDVASKRSLSLSELEIRTLPPSAVLDTARSPDEALQDSVEELLDRPFKDYFDWILAEQFSGSCGATSAWLDEITSRPFDAKKGQLVVTSTGAFLSKIIFEMISNKKRWYCRCTLSVHSFFIECIERKACVYQSYFGHYSLARSIENIEERDRMAFLPLLEAAVHNDMTLTCIRLGTDLEYNDLTEEAKAQWERKYRATWKIAQGKSFNAIDQAVLQGRKAIFLKMAPVHDKSTVQCRFNTNPATVEEIRQNIIASITKNKEGWEGLLKSTKTVRQLLAGV